jgi:lysylphosphatidylglycerol synthetase-like protein (DUF2156 family)
MTRNDQNREEDVPYEDPASATWPATAAKAIWRAVNMIAAIATLAVLAGAIWVPPEIGRGGTSTERAWQGVGVVVFIVGVVAIFKKVNLSLIYLALACAFFFVSCASNFVWKGG